MMAYSDRILILSGNLGDGHKQAANALCEAARQHYPHAEVRVIDFMELVSPRLHTVSRYIYLQGIRTFPTIYGYFYHKTRKPDTLSSSLLKKLTIHGVDHLLHLLNAYEPTVVISTFPAAAAGMSLLKTSGATKVTTVTVITDHTDHSYWLYEGTDHYIVGSERVRCGLQQLDIDDARISVTGIPIRANFYMNIDHHHRLSLREKYGLHRTKPTVMVMGGGEGMMGSGLVDMLHSDALSPMQFIIVCGHNYNLKTRLGEALQHTKHHIILTGYVNSIHEIMAMSDVMITKPGGLTTSEAIACGLPMLLYHPLPGQEQDNAKFLVEAGVAIEATHDADLPLQLDRMLTNPGLLQQMQQNTRQLSMGESAAKAWCAIVQVQRRAMLTSDTNFEMQNYMNA